MKNGPIRIGSRGSVLAKAQTEIVRKLLQKRRPKDRFDIRIIRTRGDRDQTTTVFTSIDQGVFSKEIEVALLRGQIDLAVHSLKDVPTRIPQKLILASFLKRDNPSDVLLSRRDEPFHKLKHHARIGTSSPRRARQLRLIRPDLCIVPIRGNLTTRIQRLKDRRVDGILAAMAGLERLGLPRRGLSYKRFAISNMLPAVGQGILCIQTRRSDAAMQKVARTLNHVPSEEAALCERAFLRTLRGGCRVPVGALARRRKNKLQIHGGIWSMKGSGRVISKMTGPRSRSIDLGVKLAYGVLKKGGKKYLDEASCR